MNNAAIEAAVAAAIKATGWARNFNAQFIVLPAPGSTYEAGFYTGFCGYHSLDSAGSSYTIDPYIGDEPFYSGCASYDAHKNANNVTSMIASHEYAESATDPGLNTWLTSDNYEIADICSSGDDVLPDGAYVQGLWDNYQNAFSLSDSSPPPPPSPSATTNAATSVVENEATLHGNVNPNGPDAHYYFQYGESAAYGSSTSTGDAGFGLNTVPEGTAITGLKANMTYHYRLVASSWVGTSYGQDRILRTAAWSAAVAEPGSEAIGLCVGGTSTPTGCIRAPGAEASGTRPSVAQFSDGSAAEALVGAGGHLDECRVTSVGSSKCWETSIIVASGTSPGIAEITNGSAIMAVNTSSGLQFCEATTTGPANCANAGWEPTAGASPSMAPLSDGSTAVSFVGPSKHLAECRVTSFGGSNCWETSIAVASGTSPSTAEITNGNAIVAVNTTSGLQFCEATNTGPVNCANAGWEPTAGTSPSVAPLSDGSAGVSFVGPSKHMAECHVTYSGGSNCWATNTTVASGTSPSAAEITNGNAIMAANSGSGLSFCEATTTGPANCANTGWGVIAGTSLSVAPLSDGSAAVSFIGAGSHLNQCRLTYSGGSNCYETSTTVASGTSPSMAWLPGGQVE